MKLIIASFAMTLVSTLAYAVPGSSQLTCKSAAKSGSSQAVEVYVSRSESLGTYAPVITITLNGKKSTLTTPDDMYSYGQTFQNSPLGVIVVTADNGHEKNATVRGNISVVGIPSSVKAFDLDGKPMKWSFQAEKDSCNFANGKAKFQAILHGYYSPVKDYIDLETQVLDCELDFNSGSAC